MDSEYNRQVASRDLSREFVGLGFERGDHAQTDGFSRAAVVVER